MGSGGSSAAGWTLLHTLNRDAVGSFSLTRGTLA